jgi:Mn-dependent DtxR family transcriptional regulator
MRHVIRLLRRLRLAARYWARLGYDWHRAWIKARRPS